MSRVVLAIIGIIAGCTGERVMTPTTDGGADDSADTAVTDTAAPDDGGDSGCTKVAGNLIPDGEFATDLGAWRASECKIERVPGRCGQAMRMYEIAGPARVEASYPGGKIAKGAKIHLRAWFRKGIDAAPTAPSLFIRSFYDDAGTEKSKDYPIFPVLTDEWVLTDRVFTLEHEQTGFQIMLDVYLEPSTTTQELMVEDISLVVETP